MSVLGTIRELFEASTQSANRGPGTPVSKGAYWCDDCGERIRDVDAEVEPPTCPSCGEEMTFERSPGTTSCAC